MTDTPDPRASYRPVIEQALQALLPGPQDEPEALATLVAALRPARYTQRKEAVLRLEILRDVLCERADLRAALRRQLLHLFSHKQQIRLYADTGILGNDGMVSALWSRLVQRVLPEVIDPASLRDYLAEVFTQPWDYVWLRGIPESLWSGVLDAIDLPAEAGNPALYDAFGDILDAMEVLSLRIAGTALEPEFVRNYPEIERFESPFLTQSAHVRAFIDAFNAALAERQPMAEDGKHILVLLQQCEDILAKVRKQSAKTGTSISLTWHLTRLRQHIGRLQVLLAILSPEVGANNRVPALALFQELVRAINRRHRLSDVWTENTDLLARQVTAHAARTGEHYITTTRSGWIRMLRAALGGGIVVGFMAINKLAISLLHLPVFTEAFLFSLNYAGGFVLIHMLGFTIATKQPAMTAQAIAANLSAGGNREKNLDELAQTILHTLRTQFAAIVGNVVLALPVAAALIWGLHALGATGIPPPDKAARLLHELDPLTSLAVLHAGIAGVCLFLSGLISGYFDNKAVYSRIPERLLQHRTLRRRLGEVRTLQLAAYAENNLGALAGNISLGFMLGSIGAIGLVIGLPVDIRHVSFASANLGIVLAANAGDIGWGALLLSLAGIVLIGLVNLVVSFALALNVARKSRGVHFAYSRQLATRLLAYARRHPVALFFPPREAAAPDEAPRQPGPG